MIITRDKTNIVFNLLRKINAKKGIKSLVILYDLDCISAFTYICIVNETTEGNDNRSLLLFYMANETIIAEIEGMLNDLLAAQPDDFLVSIRMKPTNNIKIFIDSDEGMSIEKCVRYNRKLYAQIEEQALFPDGNFSLEIASPGVDEPLKIRRQYFKNIGRMVVVTFNDETEKEGKLLEVTQTDILMEQTTGKGKKAEANQFVIPFDNIKSTTVQVQF